MLDGAYGSLPNDKRHKIKIFGAYQVTEEFQVGSNILVQSGRAINAFGVHPTDVFAGDYGAESFYYQGKLTPRGSLGRTGWTHSVDISLKYRPKWAKDRLTLGVDVFNIMNQLEPTEVSEIAELDDGSLRPQFLSPVAFQSPRYWRFSAEYSY